MLLYMLGNIYHIGTIEFKVTFLWVLFYVHMIEVVPCNCQFPPKSPVHWLTRYLCNDRNTVLECFWVASTDRIHRAAYSMKPDWLDSSF